MASLSEDDAYRLIRLWRRVLLGKLKNADEGCWKRIFFTMTLLSCICVFVELWKCLWSLCMISYIKTESWLLCCTICCRAEVKINLFRFCTRDGYSLKKISIVCPFSSFLTLTLFHNLTQCLFHPSFSFVLHSERWRLCPHVVIVHQNQEWLSWAVSSNGLHTH